MPVKAYNAHVLVDQHLFSGSTKGGKVKLTVPAIDAPTLQSSAPLFVPGEDLGTIQFNGYYGGGYTAGTIGKELADRVGSATDCLVTAWFDGSAMGTVAACQRTTWGQQLTIDFPMEGLITFDATFQDETQFGLVAAHQTISGTGGLAYIDFGAAASSGGFAALHVRSITGTATNATFIWQDDSNTNFLSPSTRGTFTVSAVGGYTLVVTGNTNRYARINCTSMGGATAFAITAIIGVIGLTT